MFFNLYGTNKTQSSKREVTCQFVQEYLSADVLD